MPGPDIELLHELFQPTLGRVVFMCTDPYIRVIVGQGPSPIKLVSGYAKFGTTERPRRKDFVEPSGSEPVAIAVSVLFDGPWTENKSVEKQVNDLERLAQQTKGGGDPPLVQFYSPSLPRAAKGVDFWWMTSLEWDDDNTLFNTHGVRGRQGGTATLTEAQTDVGLHITPALPKKPTVDCAKAKSKTKTYKWKKGDTMPRIAKRFLGSTACAKRILKYNKIHDAKKIKVGQVIKLPTKAEKKK